MGHLVQLPGDSPSCRFPSAVLHCAAALDGQPRHGVVLCYRGGKLPVAEDLLVSVNIYSVQCIHCMNQLVLLPLWLLKHFQCLETVAVC